MKILALLRVLEMENQIIDVWALASADEKIEVMRRLGVLSARQATDPRLNREAYYLALEGVTSYALKTAEKAILQGILGHSFFPSPPELRIQCNKAMEPYEWERERAKRRTLLESESLKPLPPKTAAAKERVSRLYAEFLDSCAGVSDTPSDFDLRERHGITDERLAELPDRAPAEDWHRPSVRIERMN